MFVDFHSHILPRADHGSRSLETSLSQLSFAAQAGVDTIVATPHYYLEQNSIDEFLNRRDRAFDELSKVNSSGINIIKAAEVQLAIGLPELSDLPKLCIEGTNYILLEFPPEPWPYWLCDFVLDIKNKRGLLPICAHIDRYSPRGREKILRLGVHVQVNASAFLGFGSKKKLFSKLVSENRIHVLGSDVHGSGKSEYKTFSKAVKVLGGSMSCVTQNSRMLLANRELI